MGNTFIISGLRAKRARLAGEIIQSQEIIARRTKKLLAIDAVLLLFTPNSDPEMIAPIRPAPRGLFFGYRELTRLCLDILRQTGKPLNLGSIIEAVMAAKGLPDDKRLYRRIYEITRAALIRLERKGTVRRILGEPDQWWELAG